MDRFQHETSGRLKPRQIDILGAVGTKRWNVKALVHSLVAGSATPDFGRRGRLVALIGGLESLGFASTNTGGEVWLTERGIDVIADAVKTASGGRKRRTRRARSTASRRQS